MECCGFGGQTDHTDVNGDDDGNDEEEDEDDDDGIEKVKDVDYNDGDDDYDDDDIVDDDNDNDEYDDDEYVTADEGDADDVWTQAREDEPDCSVEAVQVDSGDDSDEVGHPKEMSFHREDSEVDCREEGMNEEEVEEDSYYTRNDATKVIVDTVHHKDYQKVDRENDLLQQILKYANITPLPCVSGGTDSGLPDGTQVQGVPARLDHVRATQVKCVPAILDCVAATREQCEPATLDHVPATLDCVTATREQCVPARLDHVTATQVQCEPATLDCVAATREQCVPSTLDQVTATQVQCVPATLDCVTATRGQCEPATLDHVTTTQVQCVPATLDCVTATREQCVPARLDHVTATQVQCVPATLDCVTAKQVQCVPATLDCLTATQVQCVPATLDCVTATQVQCVPAILDCVTATREQCVPARLDHVTATQVKCVPATLDCVAATREQCVPATLDHVKATQVQCVPATLDCVTATREKCVPARLDHVTATQVQCVPATLDCVTPKQVQCVPATLDCLTATQVQCVPATLDCVTATQVQCVPATLDCVPATLDHVTAIHERCVTALLDQATATQGQGIPTTDNVMTTEGEDVASTQSVPASTDKFLRADEYDLQSSIDSVMASEGQYLPSKIGHVMASHEHQLKLPNEDLNWPTAISSQTAAGTVQYNFIKMEQQVVVPKAKNLNIGGTQNIGKPAPDQVDEETPLTLVQKIRKRTEARIRTWTENTVETWVFKKVRDTLDNGASWITIHGPPGEGKSTVAYMTLKDQYSKGRQVFQVESPSEFSDVTMTSSRPLIMLDDILGDLEYSFVEWSMWRQVLRSFLDPISFGKGNKRERRKKVTVLFVGRDYILQSASADLGRLTTFLFHNENTVHISSGRDVKEKVQIWNAVPELRRMDFDHEKVKAICQTNCPYGFPHVCKMFIAAYHHDNNISAEEYFIKPVEFLNQTIKKIVQDKAKRRLFMTILKRNGKVTEKELDDDDYAGYDCILAADHLIGSYLKREDGTYMFAHPSIHDITASLLIRK